VDKSGRLAARGVLTVLGWPPGTRLDIGERTGHLDGHLALAEPKKVRYRLLHVAAKLTRTARITTLRIAERWPWTDDLIHPFHRLAELPEPVT
jgi:hypothetical protein